MLEITNPLRKPKNKPRNLLTGESPVFFIAKFKRYPIILVKNKIKMKTIRKTTRR